MVKTLSADSGGQNKVFFIAGYSNATDRWFLLRATITLLVYGIGFSYCGLLQYYRETEVFLLQTIAALTVGKKRVFSLAAGS